MNNVSSTAASGEMIKTDAAIMNIYVFFSGKEGEMTGDMLINELGTILKISARVIERYGGRITQISEAGISVVFTRDSENALRCAVEICSNYDRQNETENIFSLTIGIHYGTVCMGTVGFGSFSTFVAVSGDKSLARRISELAEPLGAKILITGSAADRIAGFSGRYSSRRLGFVRSRISERDIELFDVFDGDPAETKYKKRRSRLFFEKGVELFLAESYLQARSYFIELLKFDRVDKPAKEYIFKCDSFLADDKPESSARYLAVI